MQNSVNPTTGKHRPALRAGVVINGPDDGLTSSCLSCSFFREPTELCNRYNQRPPARVIAFGCKDYLDNDEIPF